MSRHNQHISFSEKLKISEEWFFEVSTSFQLPCFEKFLVHYRRIHDQEETDKTEFFFAYIFLATYVELFFQHTFYQSILLIFRHRDDTVLYEWVANMDKHRLRDNLHDFLKLFQLEEHRIRKIQKLVEVVQ